MSMQTDRQKIIELQKHFIASGAWTCCTVCDAWKDGKCSLYKEVPPPDVIIVGCKDFVPDVPF